MFGPSDNQPLLAEPDAVQRLRELLDQAGYLEASLRDLLGTGDFLSWRSRKQLLPLLLHRTKGTSRLATLVRWFLLGQTTDLATAQRAINDANLTCWRRLGILELREGAVAAAVELMPYQGLLLAADWMEATKKVAQPVMGIAGSSDTLANLTVRRPSRRTLDLGSGSGVQAVLASAHSEHVVGVECNPRAVNLARFNAVLNRRTNLEFVEGDFFQSYEGRFDLIVANPPFVISPRHGYLFNDSGLVGDELLQRIVRTAPAYLDQGGFCQIVGNWAHLAGHDGRERLAAWCAESGCDVWVLHSRTEDVATYALNRIRESSTDDADVARQFDDWLAYYKRLNIAAISFGILTLRRRAGGNWFRCDDIPPLRSSGGDAILRGFQQQDFLETVRTDAALLATQLRLTSDLRWEQELERNKEEWTPVLSRLRLTSAFAYTGNVDAKVMLLLNRCCGRETLGAILADLAKKHDWDLKKILPGCLELVRRLVQQGVLQSDTRASVGA